MWKRLLCRLGRHDWTGVTLWTGGRPERAVNVRFCACGSDHPDDLRELDYARRDVARSKSRVYR